MQKNKYLPGCYVLNNTAVIELGLKDGHSYVINLLATDPSVRLPLSSAGTVIAFKEFENIINTHGKELIPIDSIKAEIVGLIYGT